MRFLFAAALVSFAGCVPPGSVGESQSPIVGGTTDTGDPAVVLIINGDINQGGVYLCSGEVVSPHVILTAGHCTLNPPPYNIYLGDDLNRLRLSDLLPGTAHPYPSYTLGAGNYDVGVVVLDNPLTIAPLPFNKTVDPNTLVGQSLRMVGYGSTGSTSPTDTSSGVKRTVSSQLSRVRSRLLEFDDVRHNTCEGDSGGPALAMINGVETIVGLTSLGEQSPNSNMCDGAGLDTRVELYADFIQPFIDQNDPPPPILPMPGQPPAPGQVGAGCTTSDDCDTKLCANAPNGYCTAYCDPMQSGQCPSDLSCKQVDKDPNDGYVCQKLSRSSGCDVTPNSDGRAPLLLIFACLILLAARRKISN